MKLSCQKPTGAVYTYEVECVPRLGEHVCLDCQVYVVTEVRHYVDLNSAFINLKDASDGYI
jgi:hypothetical protein